MAQQGLIEGGRRPVSYAEIGRRPRWRRALSSTSGAGPLLLAPGALLGVCLLIPLVTVAVTAFGLGLHGVADAVTDSLFVSAVRRTLPMAAIVTLLAFLLGSAYALGLTFASKPVRVVLLLALFASFWVSLLVRTYGWVLLIQPNGLLEDVLAGLGLVRRPLQLFQTTPAMYPAMVHAMLPYMIMPIYASLRGLDLRIVRAAQSLGAGPLMVLRRIVLPQMRAGAAAGAVLVFVLSLGFYITPKFLGGPSDLTVATIIDQQFSQLFNFGVASAMGLVLLVTVLAIYVVADRVGGISRQWEQL